MSLARENCRAKKLLALSGHLSPVSVEQKLCFHDLKMSRKGFFEAFSNEVFCLSCYL